MKKLLSIILALTMVIALIPAVFAADTDTKPLVYVFTQAVNGGIVEIAPKDGSGTRYAGHSFNNIDTAKSAQWRVDGIKEIVTDGTDRTLVGSSRFWLRGYDYEGYSPSALSVALNVTAEGKMSPEIAFYKRAAGRVENIWLVRKRDEAGLDDKTLIAPADLKNLVNGIEENADAQFLGTVNMKADADASNKTYQTLNTVSVTPGEYRLIFVNAEKTEDKNKKGGDIYSFTLTPMPEDTALVGAFDATIEKGVSYDAPTVTGVTVDGGVIKSANNNGTFTLTADEEKNGNKFLYWAKGKTLGKKIISFSNELTNYMPEANDKNHILIAVYEGDVPEKEEWYNANGQRIAKGTKPEKLPSMAGYGTAEGWDDYSDKIHVARYARQTPMDGINVTVEGDNTSGGGTNLTYGNTVTCTATGDNFKCWTKTGINGNPEIVSVDKVYTFQAWETCTVTAMYDDDYYYKGNTMKIIIDAFTAGSEKAVMAEFIGFGNSAVEKGIIWNDGETTTKIAMTKPGTQFTLTGNVGDTFTGYAIVDNGDGTYSEVTDGSAEIE